MCIVSRSFFNCPFFHLVSNNICCLEIQVFSFFNCLSQILVNFLWQTLLHNSIVKYVLSKDVSYIE